MHRTDQGRRLCSIDDRTRHSRLLETEIHHIVLWVQRCLIYKNLLCILYGSISHCIAHELILQACLLCIQAAYAAANECPTMVNISKWGGLALHGHVTSYRSDTDRVLPHEQYLKAVFTRMGWSRKLSTLTLESVCNVV